MAAKLGLGTRAGALAISLVCLAAVSLVSANPDVWQFEWPDTDFSKTSVDFTDIISGGPPKDGIPAIDDPAFAPHADVTDIADTEPVISLAIDGEARAYPLQILMWHEIVNDTIGDVPVTVTYCPLCNSAIAFDRRVGDLVLDFGTTGKLRYSDLVMYDRQTESWWQQFMGEAIVGEMTGTLLDMLPVPVESYASYKARYPDGLVQVPRSRRYRDYGYNPYRGYDSSRWPFLYRGDAPDGMAPLAYVLAVGNTAWSLDLLRQRGRVEQDGLIITWEPGQNSALDSQRIAQGRDIGNIAVQRRQGDDSVDVVHDLTFAFNFHAVHPDGVIHTE